MALQLLPYPYILCTSGLSFLLNNHHQIIQFEGRFIISQQILFFFFFFLPGLQIFSAERCSECPQHFPSAIKVFL